MFVVSKLLAPVGKLGRIFWELNVIVGGVTFFGLAMQMALAIYMREGHPWVRAAIAQVTTIIATLCALIWRLPGMFKAHSGLDNRTTMMFMTIVLMVASQLVMWILIWRRWSQNQNNGGIDRGSVRPINSTSPPCRPPCYLPYAKQHRKTAGSKQLR